MGASCSQLTMTCHVMPVFNPRLPHPGGARMLSDRLLAYSARVITTKAYAVAAGGREGVDVLASNAPCLLAPRKSLYTFSLTDKSELK